MEFVQLRLIVNPKDGFRRLRHGGNVAGPRDERREMQILFFPAVHAVLAPLDASVHLLAVLVSQLPYALSPPTFRFPALAALAGRAPLGGRREVALAAYLAARLADDALPERGLSRSTRAERAGHAKAWLSTLALPATIRPAIAHLLEASAGESTAVAPAIRNVMTVTSDFLDPPVRRELDKLASSLERSTPVSPSATGS